ncbi:MAG: PQQ-binding-like beta-propeller repeat protein [Candidatus Sulfotelmatobacter sp.]
MTRIRISMMILFVCFVTLASGQQSEGVPINNWSEFTRTNMHRWNPYEKILGVNTVPHLQLKWSYSPGVPVFSSPAELSNVVYAGAYDGNLYAFNATTGAKLWSYFTEVGSWIYSSPAVDNGVVYFSSVYPGVPGVIYAVKTDGTLLWSYPTLNGSYATPTVANGVVYCGDYSGTLYALNATTGALLWTFDSGTQIASAPAVVDGVVYFGSESTNVYALKASTGAEIWHFATGSQIQSSPAVANGVVYIGSNDNNFYALKATTGALLWKYTTGGQVSSSPAVAGGVVYVGSYDGYLYAFKASTGAVLWKYLTISNIASSPAVANGVVYITSQSTSDASLNSLYALNASTGALLWSYPISGTLGGGAPSVANGMVYFPIGDIYTFTGSVLAFGFN